VRKERKSAKTTGRAAQKRKAVEDICTEEQTPKLKKDNSVKEKTRGTEV